MTHEEYLARVETFTDSAGDAAAVLAHAGSCPLCRGDHRAADRALARIEPGGKSLTEEIARWSAAAAILALVVLGIHREAPAERGGSHRSRPTARYVIVGDSSGVVAYTPEGIVVGVAPRGHSFDKEITK
jgi:hypothetical protein